MSVSGAFSKRAANPAPPLSREMPPKSHLRRIDPGRGNAQGKKPSSRSRDRSHRKVDRRRRPHGPPRTGDAGTGTCLHRGGTILVVAPADSKTSGAQNKIDKLSSNPIDAFVGAKLAENHLSFSEEAAPATLIRRLSYDLTGLPPTPDEVAAYLEQARYDPGAAFSVAGRSTSRHPGLRRNAGPGTGSISRAMPIPTDSRKRISNESTPGDFATT